MPAEQAQEILEMPPASTDFGVFGVCVCVFPFPFPVDFYTCGWTKSIPFRKPGMMIPW